MSPRDRDRRRITGRQIGAAAAGAGMLIVTIGALISTIGSGSDTPSTGASVVRLDLLAARDIGALPPPPPRTAWCSLGRTAEHCYTLQESTGDATDYGSGSWHLTPTGTRRAVVTSLPVRDASTWVDYTSELASWGDGIAASGLIEAGAVPSATNLLSVSFIARPAKDGVLGAFVSHRDPSPPNTGWYVYVTGSGVVQGVIDYGPGVVNVSGTSDARHAWHCITVVFNASTSNAGRVYLDYIDDTIGAGDLSAASAGFTATAPFRIHGSQNSPSFASSHGVARLRLDENHATSLAEHQAYCDDVWQAPAGGRSDNKPLASDSSWTQTGGARCYPTSATSAVCIPGGLQPYTVDATGLGWPVEPDITNPVLYNTDIDCTNWNCNGSASATTGQVAPDGSPTASTITVAAGANSVDQDVVAGYTANASPLHFSSWIKCPSGSVDIRGNCGGTCGQITVDCSCVGGVWRYIWSGGTGDSDSCVTIVNPFNADGAGTSGVHYEGLLSPISADVWAPTLTEAKSYGRMVIPTNATGVSTGDPVWAIANGLGNTGAQLLVDGDMEAVDTSAYTAGGSAVLTKETGTPQQGLRVLRVAGSGSPNPSAFQVVLTIGKIYRFIGYARSDGSVTPRVLASGVVWTGTTSTSWQAIDTTFVATATTVLLNQSASTGYSEWDAITIYEQEAFGNYYRTGDTVTQTLTEYSGTCWDPLTLAGDLILSGLDGSTCSGIWYGLEIRK